MILKSMARQNKSFEALYDYFTKEKDARLFAFNLYSNPNDKQRVVSEFLQNAKYIKKARGKNFLFHEIISLRASSLEKSKLEQILFELAKEYIDKRAKDHLVFSAVHKEKEHLHLHLMISANAIGEKSRHRLSKKAFSTIQKNLEAYQNTHFPELYSAHYDKSGSKEKVRKSRSEQEINNNRHTKTSKDKIKEAILEIFKQASSRESLFELLQNQGFSIYIRGKNTGVEFEGKKYRFSTLGIQARYEARLQEFESEKFNFRDSKQNELDDEFESVR